MEERFFRDISPEQQKKDQDLIDALTKSDSPTFQERLKELRKKVKTE